MQKVTKYANKIIKKFYKFTNNNFRLAISWEIRKIKSLFKIKGKNLDPACKIYYGECEQCGNNYIGETVRNTVTRCWKILCKPPSQKYLRKNLGAIFIALYKPSLKDQKSLPRLMLSRNGITLNWLHKIILQLSHLFQIS